MKQYVLKNGTLYHHGIKGQKWGIRRYQNEDGSYTTEGQSENDGHGRYSSFSGRIKRKINEYSYNDKKKIKKAAIIVGSTIVASLALGIGYKVYNDKLFKNEIQIGKEFVNNIYGSLKQQTSKIGKDFNEINTKMVYRINSKNRGTIGVQQNCFHCALSYIGNSLFGKNWEAKPFDGVDEVSGLVGLGRNGNIFHTLFNGIKQTSIKEKDFSSMLKQIPNGSTGALGLFNYDGSGHIINYEKSLFGRLTLIDSQKDSIINVSSRVGQSSSVFKLYSTIFSGNAIIYDFTNASLKDNIDNILKNLVD